MGKSKEQQIRHRLLTAVQMFVFNLPTARMDLNVLAWSGLPK